MLSDFWIAKLIKYNIIEEREKDLYVYGIHQCFTIIQNVLITIIIGVVFDNLWETIIFLAFYSTLRSFSGGYHAKNEFNCFIYSIFLVLMIQIYFDYVFDIVSRYTLVMTLIFSYIICVKSPIQNRFNPLSETEKNYCKKVVRRIVAFDISIEICSLMLHNIRTIMGISMAIYIVGGLMVLERVKQYLVEK